MLNLALFIVLVSVFSSPFSIVVTLPGEEIAGLCVFRIFVCLVLSSNTFFRILRRVVSRPCMQGV